MTPMPAGETRDAHGPRPVGRRDIAVNELRSRLGRFAGRGNSVDERAEIDAAFGKERLDD